MLTVRKRSRRSVTSVVGAPSDSLSSGPPQPAKFPRLAPPTSSASSAAPTLSASPSREVLDAFLMLADASFAEGTPSPVANTGLIVPPHSRLSHQIQSSEVSINQGREILATRTKRSRVISRIPAGTTPAGNSLDTLAAIASFQPLGPPPTHSPTPSVAPSTSSRTIHSNQLPPHSAGGSTQKQPSARSARTSSRTSIIESAHETQSILSSGGTIPESEVLGNDLWALNLQVLYESLEGAPMTVAQVIQARLSGNRSGIVRRKTGLLERPLNPLAKMPLRKGVTLYEAAFLNGVPVIDYDSQLQCPIIAVGRVDPAINTGLTNAYTAIGIEPELIPGLLEVDINETGIPIPNEIARPRYVQHLRNRGYDTHMWTILTLVLSIDTETPQLVAEQNHIRTFMELGAHTCEGYFLGTGTPMGQFGRIKAGLDVNLLCSPGQAFDRSALDTVSDADLLFAMHNTMPFQPCGIIAGSVNPRDNLGEPNATVTNTGGAIESYPLFTINATAHGGPPWNGKLTKNQTLMQDFVLTADFIQQAGDGRHDTGALVDTTYNDLIRMTHIKAKDEVQNFDKCYLHKNRNIFPVNVICSTLFSSFQRMCHRRALNLLNHPTSKTLMGIPLCGTGMKAVVGRMIEDIVSLGRSISFYADNIHILESGSDDQPRYASIDLRSEESRHDERTATLTVLHILSECYEAQFNYINDHYEVHSVKGMDVDFANLLLAFAPVMLVDCVGIVGDLQVLLPGMPSGCPLTYDINSAATAPAVHAMIDCPEPLLFDDGTPTPALHAIMVQYVLPYKIESQMGINNGTNTFLDAFNNPLTLSGDGGLVPFNMLGFDAAIMRIDDPDTGASHQLIFGVLAEERYHRMFWFTKGAAPNEETPTSMLFKLRNRIMKYALAYLVLGGFLPTRSGATLAVINNAAHSIRAMIGPTSNVSRLLGLGTDDIDTSLTDIIDSLQLGDNASEHFRSVVSDALNTGLINFGSVIRMTQGQDMLDTLTELSHRRPDVLPPSLLSFEPLLSTFDLTDCNISVGSHSSLHAG